MKRVIFGGNMNDQIWKVVKAFRPVNLLMIALTMLLVRHLVVLNVLEENFRQSSSITGWQFALLVVATIYIAASGYLLNDFFDKDIDRINHPGKTGTGWNERTTVLTCLLLDLLGIGIGYLVGYWAGNANLGIIFLFAATILLIYSRYLKKIPILSNVAVSLLAALVALLPGLYETGLYHPADAMYRQAAGYIWKAIIAYAIFAFITTMIREIVKDIEDMQGDRIGGRYTIPISLGEKATKFIVVVLLLLLVRGLLFVQKAYIADGNLVLPSYLAITVDIPAFAAMAMVYTANSIKGYQRVSLLLKVIMLLGILSTVLYKVIL